MASVVAFKERFQEEAFSNDSQNGYAFSRSFSVRIDEPVYYGGQLAMADSRVPALGDLYMEGLTPVAVKQTAKLLSTDKLRTTYIVQVDYADSSAALNLYDDVAPWNLPILPEYDFERLQKPLELDYSEEPQPVLNSAEDPFDSQPMTDAVHLRVAFTRNTKKYDPTLAGSLIGSTNMLPIRLFGRLVEAGHARLLRWSGKEQTYTFASGEESFYWEQQIEIEVSNEADGWALLVLDQGYNTLSEDGKKTKILDSNSKALSSPSLLDGSGGKLASGGEPVFLSFVQYPSKDWTKIGLK